MSAVNLKRLREELEKASDAESEDHATKRARLDPSSQGEDDVEEEEEEEEEEDDEVEVTVVSFDYDHKYVYVQFTPLERGPEDFDVLVALLDITDSSPSKYEKLRTLFDADGVAEAVLLYVGTGRAHSARLTPKERALLAASKWCPLPAEGNPFDGKSVQIQAMVQIDGF
jgi:hypothetical protein